MSLHFGAKSKVSKTSMLYKLSIMVDRCSLRAYYISISLYS